MKSNKNQLNGSFVQTAISLVPQRMGDDLSWEEKRERFSNIMFGGYHPIKCNSNNPPRSDSSKVNNCTGWICPRCNIVNSPNNKVCSCTKKE